MPKISNLPPATDVTTDDYVVIVNAPGGTPSTQRATIGDLIMLAVENMAGVTWQGSWAIGTTYDEKDVVEYDGSVYIALRTTVGDQPDTSTADWVKWVAQGPPGGQGDPGLQGDPGDFGIPKAWLDTGYNSGTTYTRGDAIEHNGNTWVCVVETVSGDEPTESSSNWQRILAKGAKPWNTPTGWVTGHAYTAGTDHQAADAVSYGGSTYACNTSHTSGTFGTDLAANKWVLVASKGDTGPVNSVLEGPYIEVTDPAGPDVTVGFKTADFIDGPELADKLTADTTPRTNAFWSSDTITDLPLTVNATPKKILQAESLVFNELGGAQASQNYLGLVTGQVVIGQMDATTGYFATVWVNTDWDGSDSGWDCTSGSDWLDNIDVVPGLTNQPVMAPSGGQQWNLWSISEAKVGSTSQLSSLPINAAVPYEVGKKLCVRVVVHCNDNSNPGLISNTWKSIYGTRIDLSPIPYYTAP